MQPDAWNHLVAAARTEVRETLNSLPKALRSRAETLPVTFEPSPSQDLLDDGIESDTLGLFVGESFADGEAGGDLMPPQILLFLENLWECADEDDINYRFEIRTTLIHELGHYLGLDESDLEYRGLD
jgi:predicted Zn-dependent protease with MMP-like domain